jgi:hypothetical protein
MAYAAFPEIQLKFCPHSERENELSLALGPSDHARLSSLFQAWLETPQSELKLELSRGWTLYFKIRDGESRQYLSHPEPDLWVATFALNFDHATRLIEKLKDPFFDPFETSSLGEVQSFSNIELTWSRL